MIEQQSAHLPAVPHLFNHHAGERPTVPICRRRLEQMPLLLDTGELSIALIDNQVHKCIAHLLRGHLTKVLPLSAAFEGAKLYLFGFDIAVQSIELEAGHLVAVDADFPAPLFEQADPGTEVSDSRNFSWHNLKPSKQPRPRSYMKKFFSPSSFAFLRAPSCPLWYRSLPHVHPHGFHLAIVVHGVHAQLTAESGAFVATERQRRIHQPVRIDPHRARPHPAGDAVGFLDVTGPDRGRQPILITVGRSTTWAMSSKLAAATSRPTHTPD